MKTISALVAGLKPSAASPEASQEPSELPIRLIDHLFDKFAAIYGTKFADNWEGLDFAKVKSTWAQGLADLTLDDIALGLRALVRRGKPFPPTLPEFYAACRPPVDVPPVSDHAALDALARELGVDTRGFPTYHALRQRLLERARPLPRIAAPKDDAA